MYHKWRSYNIWFLKHKVPQTKIFVILGHFLPFQPPHNLENQNFKTEKNTWIYYHFTHLHYKWQSFDVWFLRYWVRQTEFFVILDHFLPFYPPLPPVPEIWHMLDVIIFHFESFFVLLPPNNPKNQKFEKLKKTPGNIIILHKCTINENHMMYGSWDMECDRQNFLSFWTAFCPFTPITTGKIRILKKWTICLEITLHKWTKNHDHMLHGSWNMAHTGCKCYFSFWAIFCPFTSLTARKIKILHHFTYVYQKLWSDDVQFLRYCAWTDGQMEKVTYRGGCPT